MSTIAPATVKFIRACMKRETVYRLRFAGDGEEAGAEGGGAGVVEFGFGLVEGAPVDLVRSLGRSHDQGDDVGQHDQREQSEDHGPSPQFIGSFQQSFHGQSNPVIDQPSSVRCSS